MIRKLSVTVVLALLISLLVTTQASAAKSYYAERFDVQIDIQENGSAIVTETVDFHFSGDPFTYAFRDISATNTDGITFLDASMDGMPMSLGSQAGQVEVEAGNPLKVTWHFSPTSEAAHVFTVRYRADGIIRKGDADTIIWRAIPEDHDYTINHSTITMTYPPGATLLEAPTLSRDFESTSMDNRIILTQSGLAEDEDLIITANFSPNSLAQSAPQWQVRKEQASAATNKAMPFGVFAGIVTFVIGVLGLIGLTRTNARELSISPVISNASPPSDISPAIVGKLTGQQHNFMGAIFDLAQRGFLEVREEKGFLGTKNHALLYKGDMAALNPFEQGLMKALFKSGETQINMSEVGSRLATKNKLFNEPLEHELVQRSWLDTERKQKRTQLTAVGILMMLFAFTVGLGSLVMGSNAITANPELLILLAILIGFCVGLFLLSIPMLIYAGMFSILTPAGEEQSERWKGFADYLKQVSKGKEPAISPDYFEKYLAYAAVFGLGASWAKYFQKLGGVPLPFWFHAMAGSNGDFGAMVAVMSASDTAGASVAAGGGAGASGGGASGAG